MTGLDACTNVYSEVEASSVEGIGLTGGSESYVGSAIAMENESGIADRSQDATTVFGKGDNAGVLVAPGEVGVAPAAAALVVGGGPTGVIGPSTGCRA